MWDPCLDYSVSLPRLQDKGVTDKDKYLREDTVRGEEPVFVITGRSEDVEIAKAEIMQAAEHFTQIRAQRRLQPPPHVPDRWVTCNYVLACHNAKSVFLQPYGRLTQ